MPEWQSRRPKPLVAFSCGPYAACLADGSEYTGSYIEKTTFEQLVDFHRRKLQVNLQAFLRLTERRLYTYYLSVQQRLL